jgi:hypothetical protein
MSNSEEDFRHFALGTHEYANEESFSIARHFIDDLGHGLKHHDL